MNVARVALTMLAVLGCGGGAEAPAESSAAGSSAAGGGGASVGSAGAGATSAAGAGNAASGGASSGPSMITLSLNVEGQGKVTSTAAGIDCDSSCSVTLPAGTQLELAATEQGGVLTGWTGACTGSAACSVTLGADAQITATFEPFLVGANAHGIAVTPDGTRALVALEDNLGVLKVVSLADGSIEDSIPVGSFPKSVAVTPDGSKAVVNNQNTVSVVTLSTQSVATVASPCAGDTLYDIAVTPDGASAVTTMFNGTCTTNSVAVLSLGSASMENQYTIPAQLTGGIAVTNDGASALVALGILGNKVSRVALPGGAITDIADTSSSFGIAVTPDGAEALVASGDGDTIKRISLSSNSVIGAIDYASNQDTHNIAVTPDGELAVAVGSFDVGVLSLRTGTLLKRFSGGGRSVAITRDGKRALVTLGSDVRVFALPDGS